MNIQTPHALPTVVIRGYDGGAPTRCLTEALAQIHPGLTAARDPRRAVLLIIPRRTDHYYAPPGRSAPPGRRASSAAAYDMHWAHEAVVPNEGFVRDDGTHPPTVRLVPYAHLGTLPSAPRIPDEQRIAALPEPTLDGWAEGHIRMFGGREQALAHVRTQQIINIRQDQTVDAYDWDALARIAAAAIAALGTPPKLTADQRAQVAATAVLDAERRLQAARHSLSAHLRNAAAFPAGAAR